MSEEQLYQPIKTYLEAQGYEVKGEVGACDIVAVRGREDPVVVELKESLNLALVLQSVDRLSLSETVYVAFRVGKGFSATWRTRRKQVVGLFRRLGVGLLTVSARGRVEAVLDPAPYRPRVSATRRRRLLREFSERVGDPEAGGSPARKRLTSYRQNAVLCARLLADRGALRVAVLREETGVSRAGAILGANHYGWFDRVERGVYTLSPKGHHELKSWLDKEAANEGPERAGHGR